MTAKNRTGELRERMVEQAVDILKAGNYDPITARFLAINIVADNLKACKDKGLKFVMKHIADPYDDIEEIEIEENTTKKNTD